MSIGIYVFLRIYFFNFRLSAFAQFRTHPTPSSTPPPVQRSGVCALLCIWRGLRCRLCCAVRPGALGAGVSTSGVYGASRGWGWSVARIPKPIKRRFPCLPTPSFLRKTPHPYCQSQKFRRKNKKTPTKALCSVLYLPYKP